MKLKKLMKLKKGGLGFLLLGIWLIVTGLLMLLQISIPLTQMLSLLCWPYLQGP